MTDTEATNSGNQSIDISLRERLVIPLLLPVIAVIATIILIIFVGEILLATVGNQMTLAGETVVLATWVALILTLLIMGAAVLVSRLAAEEVTNSGDVTTTNESIEDDIDISLRERLVIPLLLPVIAVIATIILIIFVGEILLATVGNQMTLAGETVVLATWVALILTLLIMGAAVLISRFATNR